jgi:nitrite reductase (NADH) small subunit
MAVVPQDLAGWTRVAKVGEIPALGARVLTTSHGPVAVFRTADDEIFALLDHCPHKGGPLSQGIVHGKKVSCPLHDWKIHLDTGEACAPDEGCTRHFPTRVIDEDIFIQL